ncbi:DUF4291 family protein, partial [Streptomyces sp. NRRL F-3273]|uniref:DUF4291 family protein n=1 Tax=Streptomyces sp. NRRL F-3273 TaxID=1463848 RepID=UPI0004CBB039
DRAALHLSVALKSLVQPAVAWAVGAGLFGLSGEAARRYADEWLVSVTDVTPLAHEIHALVRAGETDRASALLPVEEPLTGLQAPVPADR